jgi:eukaryotic-like serine/threonine-protein kinase
MTCPYCGTAVKSGTDRCTGCSRPLPSGRQVLAGLLTPIPSPATPSAADTAGMPEADTTGMPSFADRDATGMGEADADATRLGDAMDLAPLNAEAATVFEDVAAAAETRFEPGGPTSGSPDARRSADGGPLAVGQAFGKRYHIIRALGVGGMGAVYQAWDAELGVAVAIKVIRPEIMGDPHAAAEVERRFKRELLLARQVTHTNVVRIHDLGEIDGIKYITMSYVDGTDLATILKAEGRLPVKTVLHLARQVVSGLVAAHAAGVVHRDLKPANIMISKDGDALIMDFGIAHSAERAGEGSASVAGMAGIPSNLLRAARYQATMQGAIVGTVEYMAPEQAKGRTVDQRADVYALGLILYDVLVGGRRAERAESAIAELKARMEHAPPPVSAALPEIPPAVDALVSRCLEPDPAARFATSADLVAELDRLDENGVPIPIKRVVRLPLAVAIGLVLLLLSSGVWWYFRPPPPPVAHDPVSVVIADLQNDTGDPTFDRALEPTLKRALETASFISAYDRAGISSAVGVRPPEKLDEVAARELAVKQGLNVVLSGSLQRQGSGYGISVKATESVTGKVIATARVKASNKDGVLGAAMNVVSAVREALGDDTSDSARQFATVALSTTSLEVVRHHAAAMEAQSNNKYDEALRGFEKAVELDPKFGIGYQGIASNLLNLGKRQDAEKSLNEALRHLDGMTERERYNTRGLYYLLTGDYQACVKEFGELVEKYPAAPGAHNNLAGCLANVRQLPKAVDEMRRAVAILPNRLMYRTNLAIFAIYGTDFQTAEREARSIQEPDVVAQTALAFAQLGQGQVPQAKETYQKLVTNDALSGLSVSRGTSGLGDVALYEGRFSDAVRIFEEGANADLSSKNAERAAAKFTSLAYAQLLRGQRGPAIAAAKKALLNSQEVKIRLLAARVLVEAGEMAAARNLSVDLAKELQSEPQAYAKIVEGEFALRNRDPRQAIKLFTEANGFLDTWIGHFDLGRAYFEIGQFTQADSEFDRCITRRGEALALFLDEEPTYGYFPSVYYYRGRVREGMKTEGFRESYREYLNIRGGASSEDKLVPEIRSRVGN